MFSTILAALAMSTAVIDDDRADGASPAPVLEIASGPSDTTETSEQVLGPVGEYAAFHEVVADLRDAPIGSAADLDSAMDRLTAFYGEDRLVRAWIAYTALIAAQHPEYLDDVREVADYYGTDAAMSGLMYDPAYATSFVHAAEAQAAVVDAIQSDSDQIREVSERFRAAAYDLQSERWANVRARDRQDRLASITDTDRVIDLSETARTNLTSRARAVPASALFAAAAGNTAELAASPQLTLEVGARQQSADRERVGRILSVAALQAISDDPARSATALESLMTDPTVERCMAWVRLDLQQCVAAGHFKYEDSFCIAEHALLDVSRCLGASTQTAGN